MIGRIAVRVKAHRPSIKPAKKAFLSRLLSVCESMDLHRKNANAIRKK
jgi:hypothetical protein